VLKLVSPIDARAPRGRAQQRLVRIARKISAMALRCQDRHQHIWASKLGSRSGSIAPGSIALLVRQFAKSCNNRSLLQWRRFQM
jgi:hypothetical protein